MHVAAREMGASAASHCIQQKSLSGRARLSVRRCHTSYSQLAMGKSSAQANVLHLKRLLGTDGAL